jgi:hypothetical protein
MKPILTLALVLFCFSSVRADEQPGRFQLFSGNVESVGTAKSSSPVILRIDTQTGKTWIYIRLFKDGKYSEFWAPIPEKKAE